MSSDDRKIFQTPLFGRKIKKFRKDEKAELDRQVKVIIGNPEIGEEKKGDLQGVRVHKYRYQRLEMLLAYRFDELEILLITIGSHENYYRDLKSYLD
jgi:mRNA-degrading endonuclease RelE of RelBE toxin-antitoxin system